MVVSIARDMMLTPDEYMALMRLITSERESEGSSLSQRKEEPEKKRRRSKKQRAADKKSSAAFAEANRLGRKKDGSFRKGYDQARIASVAQRLKKKM